MDAWQVIPVIAVALVALLAVSRGSYRVAHGAMVTGLVMTLLIPFLMTEFVLP